MKDLKAPLLVAVPAAITIFGIIWFLRKMSGDDKDGKKDKSSQRTSPPVGKTSPNKGDYQRTVMKKEGITLTQRKIPDTADSVAGPSATGGINALTESEREKVKEIVDAAIGAGLKEARGENLGASNVQENRVEIKEEMVMESVEAVQCSINNNTEMNPPGVKSYNIDSKRKGDLQNYSLKEGNYIDSKAIADFFSNDQTTLDKGESSTVSSDVPKPHLSTRESLLSSSVSVVSASLSSTSHESTASHGETDSISISQSSSNTVPSNTTSTIKQPEVITSPLPADLSSPSISSPSSLPLNESDISSKDSVLDDSSIVSGVKPQDILVSSNNLSSSEVKPSDGQPHTNTKTDVSQTGDDKSTEQVAVVKMEETSSTSSHNSTSPVCDNNSVGSSDSGRGGSEHDVTCQSTDSLIHFDFNMPSELCGRLIGKKGYNINQLKAKSGASVSLTHNPLSAEFQICQVVGTQAEVDEALRIIRHKFPLEDHPRLTMTPIALTMPKQIEPTAPVIVPDNMQLSLPDGASVEVYVSTIVDAGHVFVQQPTHRTFMSLEKLNYFLNTVYGQDDSIPSLPLPIECGVICVCENEGSWYRAMVMTPEDEFGECQVKFVDYGGYTQLPTSCIKQIRADFMTLPFQAVECYVANIAPLQGEDYFSPESTMALSEMSQMKLLQCQVVARNEIGTPFIHLYMVNPENNTATMVNRALVNNGHVRWVEIL